MASDKKFAEYIGGQAAGAGEISLKQMMGEYLVYCDGIYSALISDNLVFIKPTDAGKLFIGEVPEEPPYPGAKPCYRIETRFEDARWFSEAIRITAGELASKKKKM
ncbi:MAG: competence protein TfoX [Bacteroidetes bacterium]|nr:competence protein TfoX [Bacteroidota bacterium]